MTSWASLADRVLRRGECEKLIKDPGRSFEFKGVGIEIPGFKLSFEGFSTERTVIEKATEAAKALDDLQYQLCQDLSKKSVTELLDRDVLTRYTKARMSSLFLFSSFRAALVAFEQDREGQKVNLEKAIEDIQRFTSSLTSEDLIAPQELSSRSRDAISSALKTAKVDEQVLDSILLDKFVEFEKTQREILERLNQVQESFETQLTELRLSGARVRLITALTQYPKGDLNCWKDAYFEDADIRNGYDARRPITDDIIKSIEAHEGTLVYGDPYVGKSILVKRVMFELADKGYAVIYPSDAADESNAYQIKDLLTSLSKTYPKILFVIDDAHKTANESFFKIFAELYSMTAEKSIRFLFAAREKQLDKERHVIERALRKIPNEAQYRIGFSLDDAVLFLQQAIKVTNGPEPTTANVMISGKNLYKISQGDPLMFSLGVNYALLGIEHIREGRRQESENLVSIEMRALIKKIEKVEKEEGVQNNELWKASIVSAVMGIANVTLDLPNLFACSKIFPRTFRTLLDNDILLKESDDGKPRIRHEMLAYEFLSVLYENKDYFDNNPEMFNADYGYIVKCVWESIGVNEIIDMLGSCSYLYNIERYKPIAELITNQYLVPLDQFSSPTGVPELDKAKLFCYGLGNFYVNRKEYKKSLDCYNKALNIKPDYVEAWINKGFALDRLGEHKDALASCDKAIELKPNYTYAWINKASALSNLGNNEEAIRYLDKAFEIDPNYASAWNGKGNALFNLGNNEDAIKCYDKAIELEPDYTDAWYNKGVVLAKLGRYEEAITCYDKALEIDPNHNAWNGKGNVLSNLGKHEESLQYFDKALEIYPNYTYAWHSKGNALYSLARYGEAITCYDKAVELKPDYADAWNNKGNALYSLARYEEAITCYDKALEIDPNLTYAWNGKGNALSNLGKHEESLQYFDKALEIYPNYTYAWNNKGNALRQLGRYEEAITCYDKALEIDPNYADAWYNKGSTLELMKRYDEAVECFDKVLDKNPNNTDALNYKAWIYGITNKAEALPLIDKALEIDPDNANYLDTKGFLLHNIGEYHEAVEYFNKSLKIDATSSDTWNHLGDSLMKIGREDEARVAYEKAPQIGNAR